MASPCQNEHPGDIVILTHPVVGNLCDRFKVSTVSADNNINSCEKGKPLERVGRKASGP